MIWLVFAAILTVLAVFVMRAESHLETRLFCAYERVFVEFEENGKIWGTLLLDYAGRPIPCHSNDVRIEDTI